MMDDNEIKSLARLAKNRLKNGYWTRQLEIKRNEIEQAKSEGRMPILPSNNYNSFMKKMKDMERQRSGEDAAFIEKVRQLLKEEQLVCNPIGRLIDSEEYNKLDYLGRQRYILNLSDRYRQACILIENEK